MFLNPRKSAVVHRVTVPAKKEVKKPQTAAGKKSASNLTSKPVSNSTKPIQEASVKSQRPVLPKSSRPSPPPRVSNKRKAPAHHEQRFSFSSSSESESSDEDEEDVGSPVAKRARPGILEEDLERDLRDKAIWDERAAKRWQIVHGKDLATPRNLFKNAFPELGEFLVVNLQYPSKCPPESFELSLPVESDGFDALDDIEESVNTICHYYFPPSQAEDLTSELDGYRRRLKRARDKSDPETLQDILKTFNSFIKSSLADGTIPSVLDSTYTVPLTWVERIINQVYARTVSPKVHLLKQYENGTDNVYGELLPRFAHEIFQETGLKSTSVFVDLGSGVGNVVLQAALQCGAEGWGIEQMDNPAQLADAQKREFSSRCKMWGLRPGKVRLLHGDFLTSSSIDSALKRADVILVNNQAFTPVLNDSLIMKFLDLKEGCQIVSLKPFVPEKWEIKARSQHDPRNLFRQRRLYYGTKSVSWTAEGGDYFIATKDHSALRDFEAKGKRRRGE